MSAKNRVTVHCAYCGKNKEVPYCRTKTNTNFFCNNQCKSKYQVKNGTIVLVCSICGDYYKVPRYFATIGNTKKSKYCSKQCHAEAFKLKRQGEGNPLWVKKETIKCKTCNKKIEINPSQKNRKYCSRKCASKMLSLQYRGSNHWNWTGGKKHYYGPDWKQIARNIRKRDNWTCQVCGIYSKGRNGPVGAMHVHHIKPLLSFNNYEEANHPSNLISLCQSCHRPVEIGKIKLSHQ